MESDTKLIQQINRGDLNAFETLYIRYRDWVYHLAYRFTRDHEIAQDVVQETFIYLLKKFPGFELTSRITTFLYPTVKFTCLNMVRQHRRNAGVDIEPETISIPAPKNTDMTRRDLASVISVLPDTQREVILMRFVDDFTIDEIAGILKIPNGTVKSCIHNALQTLRENPKTKQYFFDA